MDLLEHQGKRLFDGAGMPVPAGVVVTTPEAAREAAHELGLPVAVKAQVRTGGRGKAGGIRVCPTAGDAAAAAAQILGMTISGKPVESVLVERGVEVEREMYLAIASSRLHRGPLLIFSREGGVDIEALARRDASALVRTPVDPLLGLCDYQLRDVVAAARIGVEGAAPSEKAAPPGTTPASRAADPRRTLAGIVRAAWRLYRERDATLVEINPLVLTREGDLVCLDSKVTIDDNALFRQAELRPEERQDDREARARQAGIAFVALDGDIGVVGNGAGLVMSTIDQIAAAGGSAADFCDIGGGARADVVAAALELVLAGRSEAQGHAGPSPSVSALLVSIFGGITRCDEVARGLIEVLDAAALDVPVVVRLDGNAAPEGRRVLADAGLAGVTVAADAAEAVRLAVSAARQRADDAEGVRDGDPSQEAAISETASGGA
jgi:succinyl-CoA synthetase beta subunit